MPVTPTYPGVYIEELPSGVRTITGVATSITAFIGRTLRGAVNESITINSFGDFERQFGGLWKKSPLSYAVRDFYLNGGAQALIVRVYKPEAADQPGKTLFAAGGLSLEAASPGAWGDKLKAGISHDVPAVEDLPEGVDRDKLFNLTVAIVKNGNPEQLELFRNVSVDPDHPRRVDKVLEAESQLARIHFTATPPVLPATRPTETSTLSADSVTAGSDGADLSDAEYLGEEAAKTGIYALSKADLFNLLCIPPYSFSSDVAIPVWNEAISYCEKRRAMVIIDPLKEWTTKDSIKTAFATWGGTKSANAALFFPRLRQPDPNQNGRSDDFVPCGAIAGIFARTDTQRGVWKAPAGLDATLVGVPELSVPLTDAENGELNPLGINCLRSFPAAGRIVWGSRTLRGDDRLASEWKYIPVRRLALFLEESLYRGTQWVVFEPNDEPLWSQIRLNVGAFLNNLFRQGAFQGKSPSEAYFVKCDKETTTQNDINLGIVNIIVGYAPLKPAEFVILKFQQIAGQIAT